MGGAGPLLHHRGKRACHFPFPTPARCADHGRQRVPRALGFGASPRHCQDQEDDQAPRGLCSCAAPSLYLADFVLLPSLAALARPASLSARPRGSLRGRLPLSGSRPVTSRYALLRFVHFVTSLDGPVPGSQILGDTSPACRLWPRSIFGNAGQNHRRTVGKLGDQRNHPLPRPRRFSPPRFSRRRRRPRSVLWNSSPPRSTTTTRKAYLDSTRRFAQNGAMSAGSASSPACGPSTSPPSSRTCRGSLRQRHLPRSLPLSIDTQP